MNYWNTWRQSLKRPNRQNMHMARLNESQGDKKRDKEGKERRSDAGAATIDGNIILFSFKRRGRPVASIPDLAHSPILLGAW